LVIAPALIASGDRNLVAGDFDLGVVLAESGDRDVDDVVAVLLGQLGQCCFTVLF
jgi:hypothetical protein